MVSLAPLLLVSLAGSLVLVGLWLWLSLSGMGGSTGLWPLELWSWSGLHSLSIGGLMGGQGIGMGTKMSGSLFLNTQTGWSGLVSWGSSRLWAVLLWNVLWSSGDVLTSDLLRLVWLWRLLGPLWHWETALWSGSPWLSWQVRGWGVLDGTSNRGLGVLLGSDLLLSGGGVGELLLSGSLLGLGLSVLDLPVVLGWLSMSLGLGMGLWLVLWDSWGSLGTVTVLWASLSEGGTGKGTAVLGGTGSGGTAPLSWLRHLTVVLGGGDTGESSKSLLPTIALVSVRGKKGRERMERLC